MIPSPRIFRSRWFALLWVAGIIWTAVDVAGSTSGGGQDRGHRIAADGSGAPVDAADLAVLANAWP